MDLKSEFFKLWTRHQAERESCLLTVIPRRALSGFPASFLAYVLLHHAALSNPATSALPKAVDPEHFAALRDHSPFSRTLFLSESIVLSGRAWIDDRPVVTLIDTEEPRAFSVSESPSESGWKLIQLSGSADIETCVATIAVEGGEIIRIRYNEERIKSASQRLHFAAKKRSQIVQAKTGPGNRPGNSNHGVSPERVDQLKQIAQTDLPEGYNPGAGRSREESHSLHQNYVNRRMAGMSDRQRGLVGQMWKQQQAVNPGMPNRGASFVRILEHVANNERR